MSTHEALKRVPWLACLSEGELNSLIARAERATFRAGQTLVAELELGDELFILLEGKARGTVASEQGARREVCALQPGDACGAISLLSRGLRSLTVTAETDVVALRLSRSLAEHLIARHPEIGLHFAREIANQTIASDELLDALLLEPGAQAHDAAQRLVGYSSAVVPAGGSIRRAWRELVVGSHRELPFIALAAFIVTLLLVRIAARNTEAAGIGLFAFLRAAYLTGIAALFASTAIALARFRARELRVVSAVYGISLALILNELSVFLSFDIFYLDMTTRDPRLAFNVEALYRRSESSRAIMLVLAFLAQLTFLRNFYRRSALVLRTRLAGLLHRGGA